jgi:hypothetical protein
MTISSASAGAILASGRLLVAATGPDAWADDVVRDDLLLGGHARLRRGRDSTRR